MRLFHLVPNLNFGGLQKVVRLLAAEQVRSGHSVTVGCWTNTSNNPEAEQEVERNGASVVYLRRAANGGIIFSKRSLFRNIRAQIQTRQPDILHVHNPFTYYLYGALAARTGKTKIVNTIHLTAMFDHPTRARKYRATFWSAAMLSHAVVSVCSDVDTYLRKQFVLPKKKFFIVDNGIDLAPFLAVPPRPPRKQIVFGFAGRMAPEKNHRCLLDAFALLRAKRDDVHLRLLGGGVLEPELRTHAERLGLGDAVEFCGFSNDVPAFLESLDVYVLPSDFEAMPLSLLEAIASGLPVVATTVGAVPEMVEKTNAGWLSPPGNPQALMSAMEFAIACSGRLEKATRAREAVAREYTVERMATGYEAVYRKLL